MGYLTDLKTVASLYSASDLFIAPSLIETFGQVFIEAAACGTPSVGYPTGGVKESIADGISGKLAESINPAHLAEAIAHLYNNPDLRERLSAFGRLWVENEFSFASSAQLFWSNLRALGLLEKLGAAPGISLNCSALPRMRSSISNCPAPPSAGPPSIPQPTATLPSRSNWPKRVCNSPKLSSAPVSPKPRSTASARRRSRALASARKSMR